MTAYLAFENRDASVTDDASLLNAALEFDPPEQPEALAILRQLRRYNIPYTRGGLEDQPYLLLLELEQVVQAENAFFKALEAAQPPPEN